MYYHWLVNTSITIQLSWQMWYLSNLSNSLSAAVSPHLVCFVSSLCLPEYCVVFLQSSQLLRPPLWPSLLCCLISTSVQKPSYSNRALFYLLLYYPLTALLESILLVLTLLTYCIAQSVGGVKLCQIDHYRVLVRKMLTNLQ